MTQKGKRFNALEVLDEIDRMNSIVFDTRLLQDVADEIGVDSSLTLAVYGNTKQDVDGNFTDFVDGNMVIV